MANPYSVERKGRSKGMQTLAEMLAATKGFQLRQGEINVSEARNQILADQLSQEKTQYETTGKALQQAQTRNLNASAAKSIGDTPAHTLPFDSGVVDAFTNQIAASGKPVQVINEAFGPLLGSVQSIARKSESVGIQGGVEKTTINRGQAYDITKRNWPILRAETIKAQDAAITKREIELNKLQEKARLETDPEKADKINREIDFAKQDIDFIKEIRSGFIKDKNGEMLDVFWGQTVRSRKMAERAMAVQEGNVEAKLIDAKSKTIKERNKESKENLKDLKTRYFKLRDDADRVEVGADQYVPDPNRADIAIGKRQEAEIIKRQYIESGGNPKDLGDYSNEVTLDPRKKGGKLTREQARTFYK